MGVFYEQKSVSSTSGTIISNEELCTVGSDHAVITWVTSKPCPMVSVYIGEDPAQLTRITAVSNSKYHLAELNGLMPSTCYWYQVESCGARGSLNSFRTLPAVGGKYLFSFAIISDTHISTGNILDDVNKIYLGKLSEYADKLLTQAILDIKKRDIDLVISTGDLTDTASRAQYWELRYRLLPQLGNTSYYLCIGNHDKFTKYGGMGECGFHKYLSNEKTTCRDILYKEHLFLLLDSCRQNDNWGYVDSAQLQWVKNKLRESNGRPAFLFLHHPSNGFDLWFGLKNHRDFINIIKKFPGILGVFCGHMHRNKVTKNRPYTGELPYVEVPATVQYPCAYAVVRVYENGFEYNAYKTSRLDLSEMSRERFILKNGGKAIFTRYSFGGIGDRSIAYYKGRLYRAKLYELSIILEHKQAVKLYEKTQPDDGASLAPFGPGKTRVLLGRFTSPGLAYQAHQQKLSLYQVNARISEEGDNGSQIINPE